MKGCLTGQEIKEFESSLDKGELSMSELDKMTPEGRKDFFKKKTKDWKKMDALYQEKYLPHKNKKGFDAWIKATVGNKSKRADMRNRIEKINDKQLKSDILGNDELLDSLIEQKVGISLQKEEFGQLFDLTKKLKTTKNINTTKQLAEAIGKEFPQNKITKKLHKYVVDMAIDKEHIRLEKLQKRRAKSESPAERSRLQRDINSQVQKIREKSKTLNKIRKQASAKANLTKKEKLRLKELVDQTIDNKYQLGGLDYGRAKVSLSDAVEDMVNKDYWEKLNSGNKLKVAGKYTWEALKSSRGMKAMADFSAALRQGKWVLFRDPKIWWKSVKKSYSAGKSGFTDREGRKIAISELYARKNYDEGYYKDLNIGLDEEEFVKGMAEHIKGVKSIYNASEDSYTVFLQTARANMMDSYINTAIKNGVEVTDDLVSEYAKMINRMTGRGNLSKKNDKTLGMVNSLFFSPRKMLADVQYPFEFPYRVLQAKGIIPSKNLTQAQKNLIAKESLKNLASSATGLAGVYLGAKALGFEVELDQKNMTSSDFGVIKVGNTRFDPTGGIKSVAVLASRLVKGERKSSVTGKVVKLGEDYGAGNITDEIMHFGENRLSPVFRVGFNTLNRKGFDGKKYTTKQAAIDLWEPITIETSIEAMNSKDPDQAPVIAIAIADFLGIGANTYGLVREDDWEEKTNKSGSLQLKQLRKDVGDDNFKKINKVYNDRLIVETSNMLKKKNYKQLEVEEKQKEFDMLKKKVKDAAIKDIVGKWKYKRAKAKPYKTKL